MFLLVQLLCLKWGPLVFIILYQSSLYYLFRVRPSTSWKCWWQNRCWSQNSDFSSSSSVSVMADGFPVQHNTHLQPKIWYMFTILITSLFGALCSTITPTSFGSVWSLLSGFCSSTWGPLAAEINTPSWLMNYVDELFRKCPIFILNKWVTFLSTEMISHKSGDERGENSRNWTHRKQQCPALTTVLCTRVGGLTVISLTRVWKKHKVVSMSFS